MSYLQHQIAQLIQCSKAQEGQEPYYETLSHLTFTGGTSSGVYFYTGVIPNRNLKIDCTFRHNEVSRNTCVFGGRIATSGSDRKAFAFWDYVSGYMRADYSNSSSGSSDIGDSSTYDNTWVNIVMDKDKVYLNGVLKFTFSAGAWESSDNACPITIGAMNSGTSSSNSRANYFTGDIQQCKIWDDGVLIRDYIPVLDSQLVPCLYDRVNKTFTYSTITPTYQRWNKFNVDYIENTGTAYIPFADITPSATMGMNIEYAYTVLSSSEPAGVIGTYNGDTQRKDTFFVSTSSGYTQKASGSSCGVMVFHRGGNVGTSSSTSATYIEPDKDVWYTATVNWLADGKITWTDGADELETNVGANAVVTNQLRLFSRCNSSNSTYNNCKARTRKLQFSDGTNIIRSYKPVVWHNSDTTAIATLYDEVYNKMYTPSGSLKAYIVDISKTKSNVFTTTGATSGKAINAEGTIINSAASSYSALLPIVGGTVIECVSGDTGNNNYRFHCYDSSGTWIEQSLVLYPEGAGTVEPVTGSFTAPINAKYVRVSYATQASSTIQVKSLVETTYEVGSNCLGSPEGELGTSNCFDTGIYGNLDMQVKLISYLPTNSSGTGQLFGSYDGSYSTSQNLTINTTHTAGTSAPIRFDGKLISTPIKKGNAKVSIVDNKLGIWVDNELHGNWENPNDFTTTSTLLILKCNNSQNVRQNGCCYCLLEENLIPIAEFIPVRNKTVTTEYGLYDRVNGTLNKGVGTITFNALS